MITTQLEIKGRADLSKLSDRVIDFCEGRTIYVVEKSAVDGTKVIPGIPWKKVFFSTF